MKYKKISIQKRNIKVLIEKINSINDCVSANVVGSFTENKELKEIGDLDLVIISKKISKNFINKCKKIINKHNFPIFKKLKINDTFGPIKYDKKKFFVIHLMVYDINGHINHVIKSPFTCYDWERKNINAGKSLEDIYSVRKLQLVDFFKSRRAINKHYKDIQNETISTYSYFFKKNKYSFINNQIKLNELNKKTYCKHIINNNLSNFNKFLNQQNNKINKIQRTKILKKYNFGNFDLSIGENNTKNLLTTSLFLRNFYKILKEIKSNSNEITFIRHGKTKLNKKNIFLGRKNDIKIIDFINKDQSLYDEIFSSPLKRSIKTAKKFRYKKIEIKKELNEIDYGDVDNLKFNDLKVRYPDIIKQWKQKKDPRFPNGENLNDLKIRIFNFIKFLKKKLSKKKQKKYLVVTHNVFLRCLIGIFFNIKKDEWFKLKIDHLDQINFVMINNKLMPNINRNKLKKIMKYKINEASRSN